jgi:ribosomal protein S21
MTAVYVHSAESFDRALRRFKRAVQAGDVLKDWERHAAFMPPSQQRRLKRRRAARRRERAAR